MSANTINTLNDLTVPLSKVVAPYNVRALRRLLRAVMDMDVMTEDEINNQIGEGVIDHVFDPDIVKSERPKPKTIDYSFHQFQCKECNGVVLLPEVHFNVNDDSERLKERYACCPVCLTQHHIFLNKDGIKGVEKVKACRRATDDELRRVRGVLHTGVQGVTDIFIKAVNGKRIEARVGVAMFGSTNFASSHGACPFDPNFHDNYCKGEGDSVDEALSALADDIELMTNTLWS